MNCVFCRVPILASDYESIPAHVVCLLRVMDARREAQVNRREPPLAKGGGKKKREWRRCKRCEVIKFAVLVTSGLWECVSCRREAE